MKKRHPTSSIVLPLWVALLAWTPTVFAQEANPKAAPPSTASASAPEVSPPTAPAPEESTEAESSEEETEGPETEDKDQPEVDPYAEAKERVVRAEKLYEEGNYDAALTEFEQAYQTMLGHPARSYVLYNVGRCQEKLYRYDAAIGSYRRYLQEAGETAEDRATVEAKIELLEGLLGRVLVSVTGKKGASPQHYQLWVDGRLIGENTTNFSIPGGNHEVEVRAEGFEPAIQEVQVAARQEKEMAFELSPLAKEYKGISPTYFWVTGGLALGAAVTGATFGAMTLAKNGEINNTDGPLVTQDDADQIKTYALMADIFLISAGVLATSATVLAFMTDWSKTRTPQEEEPGNVRVKEISFAPLPSGGGYLNFSGTF